MNSLNWKGSKYVVPMNIDFLNLKPGHFRGSTSKTPVVGQSWAPKPYSTPWTATMHKWIIRKYFLHFAEQWLDMGKRDTANFRSLINRPSVGKVQLVCGVYQCTEDILKTGFRVTEEKYNFCFTADCCYREEKRKPYRDKKLWQSLSGWDKEFQFTFNKGKITILAAQLNEKLSQRNWKIMPQIDP